MIVNESSIVEELRKYRALAWSMVASLIVSVALFVQFMRIESALTEHTFLSNKEHAFTISSMRIKQFVEKIETLGREHLVLGASEVQLLDLARALKVEKMLDAICTRDGDVVDVLPVSKEDVTISGARCAAAFTSPQTLVSLNGSNSVATDLRVNSSPSGGSPSLDIRVRDDGKRELRVTIISSALLDMLILDNPGLIEESESVCLSLEIDGSSHELICRVAVASTAVPEAFVASDANVARLFQTGDLQWRIDIVPQLQALAVKISMLPFIMFGLALMIGAAACRFAYQTTDKNIRIEAHADELRERLKQLEQLEQKNNLLDQFAAMAAHDLQAPLRFIVSNAHLLIDELNELGQSDLSKIVEQQVEQGMRMRALMVDLLAFCRAGQSNLKITSVDVQELVNAEVRLLEAHDEYAGTQIIVGSLPNSLACDADILAHVFRNLLGNAVKFSQINPVPKVLISASRNELYGPWTFRITDNGPGVSEEHREVIFRPFARLDANTHGTGMGLAIVKVMLEQHGGTIYVNANDMGGSIFCFTMPGAIPVGESV